MKLNKSLFLLFLISHSAQSIDPPVFHQSKFEKYATKKIFQVIGQGNKNFGLGNWGAKGIVLYAPGVDAVEGEEVDVSALYQGLQCEHKIGYEMRIAKQDAGPLAVALCKKDNSLLQKKFFETPAHLKLPIVERINQYPQIQNEAQGVYAFPVIFVGHGIFVALTAVNFSNDSDRVSVVQIMLDEWVCKENSSGDTALCKELNELIIELGSTLLKYED